MALESSAPRNADSNGSAYHQEHEQSHADADAGDSTGAEPLAASTRVVIVGGIVGWSSGSRLGIGIGGLKANLDAEAVVPRSVQDTIMLSRPFLGSRHVISVIWFASSRMREQGSVDSQVHCGVTQAMSLPVSGGELALPLQRRFHAWC